jgi:hypothetical protein
MEISDEVLQELTLVLIYLNSWEEKLDIELKHKIIKSWKNYSFDTMDQLSEKEYIDGSHKAKSVYVLPKGIQKAKELLKKYGISKTQNNQN